MNRTPYGRRRPRRGADDDIWTGTATGLDGKPVVATVWRPTREELATLNAGGVVELLIGEHAVHVRTQPRAKEAA